MNNVITIAASINPCGNLDKKASPKNIPDRYNRFFMKKNRPNSEKNVENIPVRTAEL